jgi:replicative DNA helicase
VPEVPASPPSLPQDPAAERAVLGAVLLEPGCLGRCQEDGLSADDFVQPAHRSIFAAFLDLSRADTAVDHVTVAGRLEALGKLETVGGYSFLAGLSAGVPSVANLPHYIKTLKERSLQRKLLDVAGSVRDNVLGGDQDGEQVLESTERALFELRGTGRDTGLRHVRDLVDRVYESTRQRADNKSVVTGLATGFQDLDVLLSGLQKGDLVILAARPSMGKTAFSLNIATHATLRMGAVCAYFSLEMSREQIVARVMSSEARVSGSRFRTGDLRNDDWSSVMATIEPVAGAPFWIDDETGLTVSKVLARCRRLQAEQGRLGLVVVDYLQLMNSEYREDSREQVIASISRGLKSLARELEVPVIALSQLNRGVEQRADKRPIMSDLRESGAIEQDADVIMFLYRDEVYKATPENKGLAELLVRKHRNGAIGEVHLFWHAEFARFDNLAGERRP